jgi:hypothetical protein
LIGIELLINQRSKSQIPNPKNQNPKTLPAAGKDYLSILFGIWDFMS